MRFPPAAHELTRNNQKLREAAVEAGKPEPATEDLAETLKTSPANIEAASARHMIKSCWTCATDFHGATDRHSVR